MPRFFAFVLALACPFLAGRLDASPRYLRANQIGYLSRDFKIAIAFSNDDLGSNSFTLLRASDQALLWGPKPLSPDSGPYSPFTHTYKLDFSAYVPLSSTACKLRLSDGTESLPFQVGSAAYQGSQEIALNFYLAQRCGKGNAYAGADCHREPGASTASLDGKVVGGPADGNLINAEGGWHDSGDFIKFMVTTAWSCANLLLAYRENPEVFADKRLANGKPGSNGIPDLLDEAKCGLDWIIKMHPRPGILYNEVGMGWDHSLPLGALPQNDRTRYPTAPYRPVYYGNGANTAGKAAACLAMAAQIWKTRDAAYAALCLSHSAQIYALGKANPKLATDADHFYAEADWKDDMEWGASELYRATNEIPYLKDALDYSRAVGSGQGHLDWNICNFLAHASLYPNADRTEKARLKGYLRSDLDVNLALAKRNPYGLGVEYSWGSMEELSGVILKAQLYKKYFNDSRYDALAASSRDFLFGNNPWGMSFVVGLGSRFPHHPQHNIAIGRAIDIPGMPIEGPDSAAQWAKQGIALGHPDALALFQSTNPLGGVYHDDDADYATNECTITQAGMLVALLAQLAAH